MENSPIVCLWLEDSPAGSGIRFFTVCRRGRKWVRVLHIDSLTGFKLPVAEFDQRRRPLYEPKDMRRVRDWRRRLKQRVAQAKRTGEGVRYYGYVAEAKIALDVATTLGLRA